MKTLTVNSSNIFFTSDLHFWHKNIIRYADRPYKNVDEMNDSIIDNWNAKIGKKDTVYILGDVSFKGLKDTQHLLDQLNGKKVLIIGNHDNPSIISYFDEKYDMLGLDVMDDEEGMLVHCHLCHYPLEQWNKMAHGSINLHGHCHGSIDEDDKHNHKRLDVGVDSHNMTPISWNEIKEILTKRLLKK